MSDPRFSIQHEFDNEPTFIIDNAVDPDSGAFDIAWLSPRIPVELRKEIATMIKDILIKKPF